jgi:predicted PurR-regulated permease PerM
MKVQEIKPPAEAAATTRPRSTTASILLVSAFIGTVLYFAHAVFIPIALALLFALLLSAPVEAVNRKGFPRSVSALFILVVILGVLGGAIDLLWTPSQAWLAAAPRTSQIIQHKLGPAARIVQRIEALTNRAGHLADGKTDQPQAGGAPAAPSDNSGRVLAQTQEAMIGSLTVIILTLFLLAAGPPVLARMSATFSADLHYSRVLKIIEAVRTEVGRYYATIALINLGLALATAGVMTMLGMPNPLLWGAIAGVLNFIPYVGSATTFVILTVVALVSFDGVGRVLAVAGSYLALATLGGQVVQPLLVGQRLELNTIIVFLALWFGGWFWGIPGIVLAIPSLVALKVAAEHHERGTLIVEFLSPSKVKRFKPRGGQASRSSSPGNTT